MKCRLCLQEKELRNSHIIPEFLYRPLYDDKHQYQVVPLFSSDQLKILQKGIYEKLLCDDCEQLINKYEIYASSILYRNAPITTFQDEEKIVFENVDYCKFKLFQLSILWRAGISNLFYFENVNLGPHEEKLRQLLLKRRAGEPHEYGCMVTVFGIRQFLEIEMIVTPYTLRLEGHFCYMFLFGGCIWTFIVSNHSERFTHKESFLKKDGRLLFYKRGDENEFVRKLAAKLKFRGKAFLFV